MEIHLWAQGTDNQDKPRRFLNFTFNTEDKTVLIRIENRFFFFLFLIKKKVLFKKT